MKGLLRRREGLVGLQASRWGVGVRPRQLTNQAAFLEGVNVDGSVCCGIRKEIVFVVKLHAEDFGINTPEKLGDFDLPCLFIVLDA